MEITTTVDETTALAEKIAEKVAAGGVLCLYGDLGSGKTTFTQSLGRALGIKRHIQSPTFLIMRTYSVSDKREEKSDKHFFHVDLYRLETEQEIVDIGLLEILDNSENIVVIEWAEKLGSLKPKKRIDIHFTYLDEERRRITIEEKS